MDQTHCPLCQAVLFRYHGFRGLSLCHCDQDEISSVSTIMPDFRGLLKLATPQHDEMPIGDELMLAKIAG